MLQVKDLSVYYGEFQALSDITFGVERGQIVSVLGANGVGKSTLVNTISGLLKPRTGSIYFNGKIIDNLEPYNIVASGISLVPEGRRIFPSLTVQDNLFIGSFTPRARKIRDRNLENVLRLFPQLKERMGHKGINLSGGEQQMLAIGRALMSEPSLIIFDEISLGLSPLVIKELYKVMTQLKEDGMTIVLIEQNLTRSLRIADFAYILQKGKIVLEGNPRDFSQEGIREAYFGI